jgi:hypothetical protein
MCRLHACLTTCLPCLHPETVFRAIGCTRSFGGHGHFGNALKASLRNSTNVLDLTSNPSFARSLMRSDTEWWKKGTSYIPPVKQFLRISDINEIDPEFSHGRAVPSRPGQDESVSANLSPQI